MFSLVVDARCCVTSLENRFDVLITKSPINKQSSVATISSLMTCRPLGHQKVVFYDVASLCTKKSCSIFY